MSMKKCPDCSGELENGAMLDVGYGHVLVQRYAKADIPTGPQAKMFQYETNFEDMRRVKAHRCTKCNRIFLYAQDRVVMKDFSGQKKIILWIIIFVILIVFITLVYSLTTLSSIK